MMRLEGRVAVVTGGGNGIGRACCVRFAEEGADVVVADLLDDAGTETVALVKEAGREALFQHLDAASADDNDALAQTALERFGKVDVLVTAAGISHANYRSGELDRDRQMMNDAIQRMGDPAAGIADLDPAEWQRVLDINLTGTMLAIRAIAPSMIAARSGSIITIASIAAKRPEAGPLAYSVSKAGVWMMTKSWSRNLAPVGVRLNAIGPGYIDTNMTKGLLENQLIQGMLMMQIPMGRAGTPQEIANAALFLASDESSYFTGEILHPDGGFYTE
jgi:NAD(P)-dependent dehydrogenase (short-subunit alcohol dehydrogenase family)